MPHEVFISHSEEDRPTAEAICQTLERQGIRCWIAPRDVEFGENYPAAIVEAIRESEVMVLVWSSYSNASAYVSREVQNAFDKGKTVIPFRVEKVLPSSNLELYLTSVHWLDAMTPPMEQHLGKLVERVRQKLHRKQAAPVEPVPPTLNLAPSPDAPRAVQMPPQQSSSRATLARTLGIISLFLYPLLILGPIAIILGNKELKAIDAGQSSLERRDSARTGVVLGWISTILGIFFVLYMLEELLEK